MSLQTKSLLYQFLSFAALFIITRLMITYFTGLTGYWIPITAFMVSTILCPVFKIIRTGQGEKLYMKWIFVKGVREIR
jgi:hypothetical protein